MFQDRQCTRYGESYREVSYTPGDSVHVGTPQRHVGIWETLLPQISGSYRIHRQLNEVTYFIERLQPPRYHRIPLTDIVHVARLPRREVVLWREDPAPRS